MSEGSIGLGVFVGAAIYFSFIDDMGLMTAMLVGAVVPMLALIHEHIEHRKSEKKVRQ